LLDEVRKLLTAECRHAAALKCFAIDAGTAPT
jgi:hypothetical protein